MKIAWWPHTNNPAVASYRLRCRQIIWQLKNQGVDASLYKASEPPQILVLSKRYDPSSIRLAKGLKETHGTKIVLDLCDNHFYAGTSDPKWTERADHLRAAVSFVDTVVTSSAPLEMFVREEVRDCPAVAVIEDAVEPPYVPKNLMARISRPSQEYRLYRFLRSFDSANLKNGCRLVWFGNHGSDNADGGMGDLDMIKDRLHEIANRHQISLTVISNNASKFDRMFRYWTIPTVYIEWSRHSFSRVLQSHDLAVIPITQNPFTICKTNNRLATALLHGLGVAATGIPSYRPFREYTVLDDWNESFELFIRDRSLRNHMTEKGAELVSREWSLASVASHWLQAVERTYLGIK